MASVQDVIASKLQPLSIELTPVQMEALLVENGLNGSAPYTLDLKQPVSQALHSMASQLLAMPDVTEGGYSIKYDRKAVQVFCEQLWADISQSSTQPKVRNRSSLW